jgi:hypothetical protein
MNFIEALFLFFVFNCLLLWLVTSFNFGPIIGGRKHRKILLIMRMLLLSTFSIFLFFSALPAIFQRNVFWVYSAGISILIAVICILVLSGNVVNVLASLLPLIVITSSLLAGGFMPLTSDEGRYAGFACRILQDGKWIPFKYEENTYYQYFHLLPTLNAILSVITGIHPYTTHSILALYLTTLIIMITYGVAKRTLRDLSLQKFAGLVFIILLATPPISSLALLPRSIATTMYLSILLLYLVSSNVRSRLQFYAPMFLMALVGILSHAIFSILILASFTSILILTRICKIQDTQASIIKGALKFVVIFTTTYWIYTLIMDQIVHTGRAVFESFVDLLNLKIEPFEAEHSSWYSQLSSEFALSWTLLPSSRVR